MFTGQLLRVCLLLSKGKAVSKRVHMQRKVEKEKGEAKTWLRQRLRESLGMVPIEESPWGRLKKDTRLPVVKQNIETGYGITENNKGNGCDIAVEVGGQDEPRDVLNRENIQANGCRRTQTESRYSGARLTRGFSILHFWKGQGKKIAIAFKSAINFLIPEEEMMIIGMKRVLGVSEPGV